MARSSRLTRLDAFTKTVEDARIRTTSGGIVTLVSVVIVLALVIGEIRDYRHIHIHPELVVDKSRGEQLPINLNITFPHIPCHMLTLDVMDVSGELQVGLTHGIHKTRLTDFPESKPVSSEKVELHTDEAPHMDPNYCGSCYGAPPPAGKKCCNTCADVREAYENTDWAFGMGDTMEQCQREHYGDQLRAMAGEGCNVAGHFSVNKVVGNFHFAPGRSYSSPQMHVHDLIPYWNSKKKHNFEHYIHSLSFGPPVLGAENPLDGSMHHTEESDFNFMYFIKVVSTSFWPLDGPTVETHQYSVTSHQRSLKGGIDKEHPETVHMKGGIPGVFFSYDISPMKVINREVRERTFLGLLTGICAIIGGTLTVATVVDRTVYEGAVRMKKLHQG